LYFPCSLNSFFYFINLIPFSSSFMSVPLLSLLKVFLWFVCIISSSINIIGSEQFNMLLILFCERKFLKVNWRESNKGKEEMGWEGGYLACNVSFLSLLSFSDDKNKHAILLFYKNISTYIRWYISYSRIYIHTVPSDGKRRHNKHKEARLKILNFYYANSFHFHSFALHSFDMHKPQSIWSSNCPKTFHVLHLVPCTYEMIFIFILILEKMFPFNGKFNLQQCRPQQRWQWRWRTSITIEQIFVSGTDHCLQVID
jgi:hypothetical protein